MPICIAGMHLSGASMLAQQLACCGLYLGRSAELPRPGPDCPQGSWENLHFRSLNEAILFSLGAGWDVPPTLDPGWTHTSQFEDLRGRAAALIQRFDGHAPWGWKDARNSLTLPFWQSLVPDLKVLICLRNPLEVARSLHRRSACSYAFAFRLWLAYYQHLLAAVPRGDRVVTHFDAHFLDSKAELHRILGLLGLRAAGLAVADAVGQISPSLRHEWARTQDLLAAQAPPDVVQCYLDLCAEAGPVCARALEETPAAQDANSGCPSSAIASAGGIRSPVVSPPLCEPAAIRMETPEPRTAHMEARRPSSSAPSGVA